MAAVPEELADGGNMFTTIHGAHHLNKTTMNLSNSDSQLATLVNRHGARKFWAGVKSQGLEPDDVNKHAPKDEITVHEMVPSASVPGITEHRTKLWDGLRESRIHQVETALEDMNDESVNRYFKCKTGVHAVDPYKDLPPVDKLAGMDKFNEMQAKHHAAVKEEQRKKATALGMEFLMEKKKRDDADAKVAAFEKRVAEYKAKLQEEYKARAVASVKKAEKRKADSDRAAAARATWEAETEVNLWNRFEGARSRRHIAYSPDALSGKLEAAKNKRTAAFNMATKQEEELLESLENRRIACEERLDNRRQETDAYLAQRAADSQAKFQNKQVMIHAKTTEWVNDMLENHKNYKDKCQTARNTYATSLKDKTKATKDTSDKAYAKVKANKEKLKNNQDNSNEALMQRHAAADQRREELNGMKFKNENDIYTYTEIKHNSFGELTKRRNKEIKKRTDAQQQHLVYVLAERQAKNKHQELSQFDLRRARQQIAKESLTFSDQAQEGFLKIQSEPDPAKVVARMNAMGFDMPKLPEKDEEGGEEEQTKGY